VDQARLFSNSRLLPTIYESPLLRRALIGEGRRPQVMNLRFRNGTEVNLRAAFHSADAARGLDADVLVVDEFQDIAPGDLPILEECLSHSPLRREILTGTPKLVDNHLEAVFRQSTACQWQVPCPACRRGVILDERALGPSGPICPGCREPIDPRCGAWVPRNPSATWGAGFWINHLMVPWIDYPAILERQRVYDATRFKNEVLGLPTSLGEHTVTRAELEACCRSDPMAQSLRDIPAHARGALVAGIDWGGGGASRTVLVIGFMAPDYRFHVSRFERFAPREDPLAVVEAIADRCRRFPPRWIAADAGGNGLVLNRLLWERIDKRTGFAAILYSTVDHEPYQEGVLWKWVVGRSSSLGTLFARVRAKKLLFPREADCGSYLDELGCVVAVYDDVNRSVKFTHPPNQQDDAVHATNYALLVATRMFNSRG
jgi:hypothetical protein